MNRFFESGTYFGWIQYFIGSIVQRLLFRSDLRTSSLRSNSIPAPYQKLLMPLFQPGDFITTPVLESSFYLPSLLHFGVSRSNFTKIFCRSTLLFTIFYMYIIISSNCWLPCWTRLHLEQACVADWFPTTITPGFRVFSLQLFQISDLWRGHVFPDYVAAFGHGFQSPWFSDVVGSVCIFCVCMFFVVGWKEPLLLAPNVEILQGGSFLSISNPLLWDLRLLYIISYWF